MAWFYPGRFNFCHSIAAIVPHVYNERVMSTPEIVPQEAQRQPEVTARPEQFIVPETAQQLGVTAPQHNPQPLHGDNNQVLVQPIPTTPTIPTNIFTISTGMTGAHDMKELEKLAHGPDELSRTWYDMLWLREAKRKIMKGIQIIFGE